MTIKLAAMICTAIVATIGFILAYKKEEGKGRRVALAIGFIFTIFSGLLGLEEYFHHRDIEDETVKFERDWLILKDTPVSFIEFEVMSQDGMLTSPSLLDYARSIEIEIPGVYLGPSFQGSPNSPIFFSRIFSVANISERGRLGRSLMRISGRRNGEQRLVEKTRLVGCTTSRYITSLMLSEEKSGQKITPCSVTTYIKVLDDTLRLATIASWSKITMKLVLPQFPGYRCDGLCQAPIIVSMRLVLRHAPYGNVVPTMIEISPSILSHLPFQQSNEEYKFEMPGETLLELAKSHYLKSFGYSAIDPSPSGTEVIAELYRRATERDVKSANPVDFVWTTIPYPDTHELTQAIPVENRDSVINRRVKEWCGFGEDGPCWYRFMILKEGL